MCRAPSPSAARLVAAEAADNPAGAFNHNSKQRTPTTGTGHARTCQTSHHEKARSESSCFFPIAYAGYGMAADSVRRKESGTVTRMLLRTAVTVFNRYYREKRMRLHTSVMPTKFSKLLKENSIQRS